MARSSGMIGIAICTGFMILSATFLLVARDLVVSMYTDDVAVKSIAISLLLMAAIFQVADGIQVGAAGALRGYKDTRWPMVMTTFAYWVIAFPLAYMAAVSYELEPRFIWGGFVAGLSVAAVKSAALSLAPASFVFRSRAPRKVDGASSVKTSSSRLIWPARRRSAPTNEVCVRLVS